MLRKDWASVAVARAVSRLLAVLRQEEIHPAVPIALVVFVFGAAFHQFIEHHVTHRINDFGAHLAYAEYLQSGGNIRSPHFLFQLLIVATRYVSGVSLAIAAMAVLAAAYGGMALLLVGELRRRRAVEPGYYPWVVVPALLLASHLFVFTLHRSNLYWGYLVPVLYSNPTQQLNKLFALWIYLRYMTRMLDGGRPGLVEIPVFGFLTLLSALAKPSFLIAFLPVAGFYGLLDVLSRRWRHASVFVGGVALPAVAILLWQAGAMNAGSGMSVAFAPFALFDPVATSYKLPASLAFPLVVAFVAFHAEANKARMRFLWLFTAVAVFCAVGFVETGPAMNAGNFAWTGQTAVFLAYVESVLFLMSVPAGTPGRRVAWAVFAAHVACGVFWYGSIFLFPNHDSWL